MRVFCASIATETNTFSPLRMDFSDFEQSFYAPPGKHPETPTLCSAVFPALRARAAAGEIVLIEGTATWAEPGGLLNAKTWKRLYNEVLEQLKAALPVEAVIFGLHGGMIADGCVDCEGHLLAAARKIVGPDVVIGVSFDPHSHLSNLRVKSVDIITVFKEFPHTDFVETGEACVDLTLRTVRNEIDPVISVFDVHMIDVLPTSRNPMRSFVDKMLAIEQRNDAISVSLIHGFMAGDSPDLGAKIIVITDGNRGDGEKIAQELGQDLFALRGTTKPDFLSVKKALEKASIAQEWPIVVADVWDNPGGGVAGDSTQILREALKMNLASVALGTIWDPMAVRLCFAAGEGANIDLRFGGKTSAYAGDPMDASVRITKLVHNAVQRFGRSIVPLGDCAAIKIGDFDIVLNSNRSQAFSPDIFTNLGIDIRAKKVLIIKSTNHFYSAFAPVVKDVIYAAVDGPYPHDPKHTNYRRLTRALWPIVDDPFTKDL